MIIGNYYTLSLTLSPAFSDPLQSTQLVCVDLTAEVLKEYYFCQCCKKNGFDCVCVCVCAPVYAYICLINLCPSDSVRGLDTIVQLSDSPPGSSLATSFLLLQN